MKSINRFSEFALALLKKLDGYGFRLIGKDKLVQIQGDLMYLVFLYGGGKWEKYCGENMATFKIGIISIPLAKLLDGNPSFLSYRNFNIKKPKKQHTHWSKSAFFICDVQNELWLPYGTDSELETSASEVASILIDRGFPDMFSITSTEDLVKMWDNDRGPGLSSLQAANYSKIYKDSLRPLKSTSEERSK